VLILLALGRGAMDATAAAKVPFWTLLPVLPSLGESVVVLAWLAVVLLGLTGCRGAAAVIAAISLTLAWLAVLTASVQQNGDLSQGLFQFLGTVDVPVVLASLAACSLALSPGPLRGLAIVGWRRACLMIAGLSAGFGFPSIVQLVHPAAPSGDLAFRLLGVLAIALAVAVTRVRGPVGRRVAGLVAAGLLPSLAVLQGVAPAALFSWVFFGWTFFGWTLLVILLVAVLAWPVAIVSWLGRVRPAPRAG
jgi:hypothetical protein